jgi:hypothetical protein
LDTETFKEHIRAESKKNPTDVEKVKIEKLQFNKFESILYPSMNFTGGKFEFIETNQSDTTVEFITRKIEIKGNDKEDLKTYDSVVFFSSSANAEQQDKIRKHLSYEKILYWWLPYFLLTSIFYICLCTYIMWAVSIHLTDPIIELTEIIK